MSGPNTPYTHLDYPQVLQQSFEESKDALRTHSVGGVTADGLTVLASVDVPFGSIPNNVGSPHQITSGLSSPTKRIIVYDTTGLRNKLWSGSTPALLFLVGPGSDQTFEVQVPVNTPISITTDSSSTPTAGSFTVTFLG